MLLKTYSCIQQREIRQSHVSFDVRRPVTEPGMLHPHAFLGIKYVISKRTVSMEEMSHPTVVSILQVYSYISRNASTQWLSWYSMLGNEVSALFVVFSWNVLLKRKALIRSDTYCQAFASSLISSFLGDWKRFPFLFSRCTPWSRQSIESECKESLGREEETKRGREKMKRGLKDVTQALKI